MKHQRLLFAFALGAGLTLALVWLMGGGALATRADSPHRVAPDCAGILAPCHTSLQDAVDAAIPGDTILIAAGVYSHAHARPVPPGYPYPPAGGLITQVVYLTKTVTLRGGYTTAFAEPPDPEANPTTLDAQGTGRAVVIAGNISPTLSGLRLTGGDAAGLGGHPGYAASGAGGGVYVITATVTLSDSQVFKNTAWLGGGLYLLRANATLGGNNVLSNTANGGGGLFLNYGIATLSGNTILSNTASGDGGGLYQGTGSATLQENTILSNTANDGGGLFLVSSNAALYENVVRFNTASYGGGLYVMSWSKATLTNTVIADNRASNAGGVLYVTYGASARLLHTTLARNSGGDGSGIYVTNHATHYSTVAMTNTIFVSHTVGISATAGNTATLGSTLWHGNAANWGGAGAVYHNNDYTGDPAFAADGYHLMDGSAAINKGGNAGVTTDIDGDARDSLPDLGADERGWRLYLPLVMRQ